jgi:hypothetical protein
MDHYEIIHKKQVYSTQKIFHITLPTSRSMKRATQNALYRSDAEMQSYAEQLCGTLRLSVSGVKGKTKKLPLNQTKKSHSLSGAIYLVSQPRLQLLILDRLNLI